MTAADALVLFGATGDLASRMIFPALAELVRKRRLNVPVIGVAKSELTSAQLYERVRRSLEQAGLFGRDVYEALCAHLSYVGGDYAVRLRGEAHVWRSETVANLQHAARGNARDKYREFARLVNDAGRASA